MNLFVCDWDSLSCNPATWSGVDSVSLQRCAHVFLCLWVLFLDGDQKATNTLHASRQKHVLILYDRVRVPPPLTNT